MGCVDDLFDRSPLAMMVVADDLILRANPAAAALLCDGAHTRLRSSSTDSLVGMELIQEHLFGEPAAGTDPLHACDGVQRAARIRAGKLPWQNVRVVASKTPWHGQEATMLCLVRDSAAHPDRVALMSQELTMYRQVLQISGDGYFLIDVENMSYIDVNEAAAQYMGCSREELLRMGPLAAARLVGRDAGWLRGVYRELIAQSPQPRETIESVVSLKGRSWMARVRRQAFQVDGRWVVVLVLQDVTTQHQTRDRLARFAAVTNLSPDAILLTDCETARFIDVNDGACSMFGYSTAELLALEPYRLGTRYASDADLRAMFQRVIDIAPQALREGMTGLRRDGSQFPAEITRQAMQSEGRWVLAVTIRDISEPKRTQQALERFRAALDQATDAILLVDPVSLRYVDLSESACRLLGGTRDQLMAEGPVAVARRLRIEAFQHGLVDKPPEEVSPGQIDPVEQSIRQGHAQLLAKPGTKVSTIDRMFTADGRTIEVEVSRVAAIIHNEPVIVLTVTNVSDRVEAQRRERTLAQLTNLSADGLFVVDYTRQRVVYANEAGCSFLNRSLEQILAMDPLEPGGPYRTRAEIETEFQSLVDSAPSTRTRVHGFTRRDGAAVWLEIVRQATQIDGTWYITTLIRDITERKRSERRNEVLAALSNMASDAFFVVDHDDMRFVYANQAACRYFGMGLEELMARDPRTPDGATYSSPEEVLRDYREVMACSPEPLTKLLTSGQSGNTTIWLEVTRQAVPIDGRTYLTTQIRDVTASKSAQLSLERFRVAMDRAGDGIVLVDAETLQYLDLNETACRLFGCSYQEAMALGPLGVARRNGETISFHEHKLRAEYQKLITDGGISIETVSGRHADGSRWYMDISRAAQRIGERWMVIGVMRDVTEQRRAHVSLERFRSALDKATEGIVLVDAATNRYIDVNEAACGLFDIDRQTLMALGPIEASRRAFRRGGDEQEQVLAMRQRLMANPGQAISSNQVMVRGDGSVRQVAVTRIALFQGETGASGHTTQDDEGWLILTTLRDITEQHAAQLALERFRAVVDLSTDGIVVVDPETLCYVDINQTACRLFGLPRETMMSWGPVRVAAHLDITGLSDESALREDYRRIVSRPDHPEVLHVHVQRTDGHRLHLEYTRVARRIDQNWLIITAIRDVTESRLAHLRNERLAAIVNLSADAMFVTDMDSARWIEVNDAACLLYGATREQLLAMQPWRPGTKYPDEASIRALFAQVRAAAPQPVVEETQAMRRDGSRFLAEIQRQAVQVDGRWLMLAVVRDVTERRAAQRALERFRAAVDQSTDGIVVVDPDTLAYVDINQRACEIFGFPREEMLRMGPAGVAATLQSSTLPDEAQLRATYRQLTDHPDQPQSALVVTPRADGSKRHLEYIRVARRIDGRMLVITSIRDVTESRMAQMRNERLAAIVNLSVDAILISDMEEARWIEANDAACALFGKTRDQLLQMRPWVDNQGYPDEAALRGLYSRVMARAPQPLIEDIGWVSLDGQQRVGEVQRQAMQVDGRWVMLSLMRDVTEQRASRVALQRFRTAIDEASDGIVLIDLETQQYLDINASACRLFGLSREEMIRLGPLGVLQQAAPDMTSDTQSFALQREALEQGATQALVREYTVTRPDGTRIEVETTRTLRAVDDKPMMLSVMRDVTEQRAAQRRLERFRVAMDQTLDSVVLVDRETLRFVDVNREAARRAGMPVSEYLDSDPWERRGVTADELAREFDELIAQAPRVQILEKRLPGPEGAMMWAELNRTAVQIGGRWTVVTVSRDITKRKQSEIELRQRMDELARSNRELEQFAYVASHDLSEPLRMVASYTQLLQRRYQDQLDDDGREFMGYVIGGAQRMKQLIDDLLAYSRAGRQSSPKDVDAANVAAEVQANLASLIAERQGAIVVEALPRVHVDKGAFTQLMQNLIGNALKFSPEPPAQVRVWASRVEDGWQFSVADQGIGIEARYFERIFVIFQRLHARDQYAGTGIGLAICKRIVESWGGRIWVESEPGRGSTFHFTVPDPA